MPEVKEQGARPAGLVTPGRVDGVFEDPGAIRRLVQRNGPYRTMASYLPDSAVRGRQASAGEGVPPHFRATWAAGGRPLAAGAEVILHNPRLLRAASQLFDAAVIPNTVAVNVNAPMPAGAIHVDVPSFRGADRDRYPIQLLQAMAASGLFEDWRVAEAGAVFWSYHGRGGAYDYWPDGLDGPMRSEYPPFTNSALVADNNRMYHRIGWVGDPAAVPPSFPPPPRSATTQTAAGSSATPARPPSATTTVTSASRSCGRPRSAPVPKAAPLPRSPLS
jgi:hypothetical protein